jgi:hypothetical protein
MNSVGNLSFQTSNEELQQLFSVTNLASSVMKRNGTDY